MFDPALIASARTVLDAARAKDALIVTAESCTGGLVASLLTAVPGSSDAVFGGYVTYANTAKIALGVPDAVLSTHGAVSAEVARALAGAAHHAAQRAAPRATIVSVAVTGVAGPGGGSATKPVGLVHFASAFNGQTTHRVERFGDLGRDSIRKESVIVAFAMLRDELNR